MRQGEEGPMPRCRTPARSVNSVASLRSDELRSEGDADHPPPPKEGSPLGAVLSKQGQCYDARHCQRQGSRQGEQRRKRRATGLG